MKKVKIFLIILISLISCEREFDNAVDPRVNLSAPDLSIAQEGEWIYLSWQKSDDITSSLIIERKEGIQDYNPIAILNNTNQQNYIDSTSRTGIAYSYRIKGFSDKNSSEFDSITYIAQFPPPTNVNAENISDVLIQVNWQDNCTFEQGYILERKPEAGTYSEISRLPANTES